MIQNAENTKARENQGGREFVSGESSLKEQRTIGAKVVNQKMNKQGNQNSRNLQEQSQGKRTSKQTKVNKRHQLKSGLHHKELARLLNNIQSSVK